MKKKKREKKFFISSLEIYICSFSFFLEIHVEKLPSLTSQSIRPNFVARDVCRAGGIDQMKVDSLAGKNESIIVRLYISG